MAIEGGHRSRKAPTIASSAPLAQRSPARENPPPTLALAQPSAAPQEQADSRSALPPTVHVPEVVIGGGRHPALDGGSQWGSGTEISRFVAAPPEATGVSDPAGLNRDRDSGFLLRSRTSPMLEHRLNDAVWDAQDRPAPRHDIGVIGDRMPAGRGPVASEMAMVPWCAPHAPHVGTLPLSLPEPARTTVAPTGPKLLRAAPECRELLPFRQHQHAQSPLRLESLVEPTRDQSVRHRRALAPSRPDNSAPDNVVISRADAQRGWDQLQARRRECEELREQNYTLTRELALQALRAQGLQQECGHLRQEPYQLHQTPQSSSGSGSSSSRSAGERRSEVCGDCFRPAQMVLGPCSRIALCHGCYLKRRYCPCCGARLDFQF